MNLTCNLPKRVLGDIVADQDCSPFLKNVSNIDEFDKQLTAYANDAYVQQQYVLNPCAIFDFVYLELTRILDMPLA